MNFDLAQMPFSRYGSYIAVSHAAQHKDPPPGLFLRTVHGRTRPSEVFRLEVTVAGKPVPIRELASPDVLRLEAEGATVELAIPEPKVLRIRGRGAGLRLTVVETGACSVAFRRSDGRAEINTWPQRLKWMLTALAGDLRLEAPWRRSGCPRVAAEFVPDAATGGFEAAIEEFQSAWLPREYPESFDAGRKRTAEEFERYRARMPAAPADLAAARDLAAYVTWSSVVEPAGHYTRPAMLMSKNWMSQVWSWDHCFNALALASADPLLAWDQMMLLFDHQDATGAIPDSVNDQAIVWNYSKPPIHGWTLSRLMRRPEFRDPARLREIYEPLVRWTEWFFAHRDDDGDGIPDYRHGNDSGWDNATPFDVGVPLEGPDLSAYLVLQMEALAQAADLLGRTGEGRRWQARARDLLGRLLAHSWRDGAFVALRSGDHARAEAGDSLFEFLPIILGPRLPKEVHRGLAAGLAQEGRFLTPHGLATESPRSPLYESDGYWRGPIWAPSTMLVADGLASGGEGALAREVSARFCRLCARSGFAENFDALSGAGLRDRAYTWTASAFLVLAEEFLSA